LDKDIPISQTAYRKGRSTTENVFTFKILAEKAIIEDNAEIHLRLLDMSKAFDNVSRENLMKDLKEILQDDELHMVKLLVTQVNLQVRNNNTIGEKFKTSKGIPQGDCLSPMLFIFYLEKTLKENNEEAILKDHTYNKIYNSERKTPKHLIDHDYSAYKEQGISIHQEFADDISRLNRYKDVVDEQINDDIEKLKKRNFIINKEKTEEYNISKKSTDEWKKCKYLGSLLGTEEDINRRKQLSMAAYNTYKKILESRKLSIQTRSRLFNTYISSIFLYNSELWTLTKELENKINVFQRSLMKKLLKIHYPFLITNIELYKRMNMNEWSKEIRIRRMKWLGHLLRLNENSPASIALKETNKTSGKKKTGNHQTWRKLVNTDLKEIDQNLSVEDIKLETITEDRKVWYETVQKKFCTVLTKA